MTALIGSAPPPHLPVRPDWLALRHEPPIDPAREIVDAHHHLWDRPGPGGRYLLPELLADVAASGHHVVQTIYVQARSMYLESGPEELRPVGEATFAAGVAAEAAKGAMRACDAIVGCADLTLGDRLAAVLDALAEAARGRLKGIRFPVAWHPDARVQSSPALPPEGLMLTSAFQAGARRIGKAGLSLDVWAYHTQLEEVAQLARSAPDLVLVLDHAGGPVGSGPFQGRRDAMMAEWQAGMRVLSTLPNVRVKLGGLAMAVSGYRFHENARPPSSDDLAAAWRPVVDATLDLFGPTRCMFESNFPVDKGMVTYGAVWNAFKLLSAGLSDPEKDAVFAGTARATYGMPVISSPGVR